MTSVDLNFKLWDVIFEPDPENKGKYLPMVATGGGNTICVTNYKTGEVPLKYVHRDIRYKARHHAQSVHPHQEL